MTDQEPHTPLALITGGSGFLGKAIAAELTSHGWRVASLSRTPSSETSSYTCDISKKVDVDRVVKQIAETHGRIRAVIHAAAIPLSRKPVLETEYESVAKDIATSLYGAFFIAEAACPHMEENAAFIGITTEAIESNSKVRNLGSYITTKYALRGFLATLSREIDPKKIRIYAVAPGFLAGGLNSDLPEQTLDFLSSKHSESSPKKTAGIVASLCIDPNAYPSGCSILVSSGNVSPL